MAGKGSRPRPVDQDKFGRHWERIFGGDRHSTARFVNLNDNMQPAYWSGGIKDSRIAIDMLKQKQSILSGGPSK